MKESCFLKWRSISYWTFWPQCLEICVDCSRYDGYSLNERDTGGKIKKQSCEKTLQIPHPLHSNIHELMSEEIVLLHYNICPHSLFHTCKQQQALTVRLGPWGSHSFPLEPAVSNNVCMLHLPRENYTFSFFDSLRDFIWKTFLVSFSCCDRFHSKLLSEEEPLQTPNLLQGLLWCQGEGEARKGWKAEQSILRESELTWEHFWAYLLKSSLWEGIRLGAVRAGFWSQIQNFKWLNLSISLSWK